MVLLIASPVLLLGLIVCTASFRMKGPVASVCLMPHPGPFESFRCLFSLDVFSYTPFAFGSKQFPLQGAYIGAWYWLGRLYRKRLQDGEQDVPNCPRQNTQQRATSPRRPAPLRLLSGWQS